MLLEGIRTPLIVQHCSERWGVGERQGLNYVRKARRNIAEEAAEGLELSPDFVRLNLLKVFEKASAAGNISEMRRVLELIAKILGLFDESNRATNTQDLSIRIIENHPDTNNEARPEG